MTKGNKWFVTRKPSSEFQLYDFARSARQAKDMLESIADGSPIAHRSKSEGGLYNIYVKKGSVYALEKGGMIEVGDKVRAVRDGVGAFSIGKGQTGIVEEITSGGRGVIIELTNGSRRETLIEDIEKHNFRMYAEGGEIPFDIRGEVYVTFKDGREESINVDDDRRFATNESEAEQRWMNTLLEDEDIEDVDGSVTATRVLDYEEGGEIARKMLLQNKGVKEVIRKETVNEIRGAIEKEGYNTKGVTDDEILMIYKELQSSFYAEGGEIKGYSGGYDVTIFYTDGTQTVLEGGLPYPEALRIAKKQKIENDVEEVAVIVTDQSSMPHGEQTIRWISGSTYAEGGEIIKEISTHKAVRNGDKIDIISKGFEIGDLKYSDEVLYSIPTENEEDLMSIFDNLQEENRILLAQANGEFSKGGSTYAEGGSIKSNWFSGELSFLNW